MASDRTAKRTEEIEMSSQVQRPKWDKPHYGNSYRPILLQYIKEESSVNVAGVDRRRAGPFSSGLQ